MNETYNIYCDESCHLENDHQKVMVLGAVWCPEQNSREIADRIRDLKRKHGLSPRLDVKWTKVSPSKENFYLDLVDYFFDSIELHFRALIVPDKSLLRHGEFQQDHDTWYYKMYYDMLKIILTSHDRYRIYLDIKDTRSSFKVKKLHEVLCNSQYDFQREIIERVQTVRSEEVEQIQLADVLIGAVSYVNRGITTSPTKLRIIEKIRYRTGFKLTYSTLFAEPKFNLFRWQAKVGNQ